MARQKFKFWSQFFCIFRKSCCLSAHTSASNPWTWFKLLYRPRLASSNNKGRSCEVEITVWRLWGWAICYMQQLQQLAYLPPTSLSASFEPRSCLPHPQLEHSFCAPEPRAACQVSRSTFSAWVVNNWNVVFFFSLWLPEHPQDEFEHPHNLPTLAFGAIMAFWCLSCHSATSWSFICLVVVWTLTAIQHLAC